MKNKQVLSYVDAYFRATLLKSEIETKEYPYLTGCVDGIFSEDMYNKFRQEITEKYQSDGYKVNLQRCSKEEFDNKIEDDTNTPIGYIKMYLLVTYEKDGEETAQFMTLDFDFNNFSDETLFDIAAPSIIRFYEENECKNISVCTVSKELYEKETKNQEIMAEHSWKHEI